MNIVFEKRSDNSFGVGLFPSNRAGPTGFERRTLIIFLLVGWLEVIISRLFQLKHLFFDRTHLVIHLLRLFVCCQVLPRKFSRTSQDRIPLNYTFQGCMNPPNL